MATNSRERKETSAHVSTRSHGDQGATNDTSRTDLSRREGDTASVTRGNRDSFLSVRNPFEMMRRMSEQMDRMVEGFGLGRGWLAPTFGRGLLNDYGDAPWRSAQESLTAWSPEVEVYQRDDQLVVRADVPGLSKEDLHVEIRGEHLVIDGERREQTEENREGYRYSERRYGRFHREIPLPDGATAGEAHASFKDGVLEVTMPAPKQEGGRGGRELPIE